MIEKEKKHFIVTYGSKDKPESCAVCQIWHYLYEIYPVDNLYTYIVL